MPHIHLSGTAIVESSNSIYHQMTISKYTPFTEKNFYKFFSKFGKPYYIKAAGRDIAQYDRADIDKLMLGLIDNEILADGLTDAEIDNEIDVVNAELQRRKQRTEQKQE